MVETLTLGGQLELLWDYQDASFTGRGRLQRVRLLLNDADVVVEMNSLVYD